MNDKERIINFLNISNFLVEIEKVRDRSLNQKACVIAPLNSDCAKIWDISSELSGTGIVKGMELAVARKIYKNLKVIPPNPDLYDSVHGKILYQLSKLTPLYETDKRGGIFLDFSGFELLYGDSLSFGRKVINSIHDDFSLRARLGIASTKLVSKAATNKELIEESLLLVRQKETVNFLNPFPLDTLPAISKLKYQNSNEALEALDDLSLEKILDIKKLDIKTLGALFPQRGEEIYHMARGVDNRVVCPPLIEPVISRDIHLAETNEISILSGCFYKLADEVCERARSEGKLFKRFRIGLRYSDFRYREKRVNLKKLVSYSYEIYEDIRESFYKLFDRRVMVRYVFFEIDEFVADQKQLNFFSEPKTKVFDTLDEINRKYPNMISIGRVP